MKSMENERTIAQLNGMLDLSFDMYKAGSYSEANEAAESVVAMILESEIDAPELLAEASILVADSIIMEHGELISLQDGSESLAWEERVKGSFTRAVEVAPSNELRFEAVRGLGDLGIVTGRFGEGIEVYGRALELADDVDQKYLALTRLGIAEANDERCSEAINHLKKALELLPELEGEVMNEGLAKTYYMLGYAYDAIGQTDASIDGYKKAIELLLPGKSANAYSLLEMTNFDLGHIYLRDSLYQEAEHHFSEALLYMEKAGESIAGRPMILGETYFWMGEYDKAVACLRKAQEMNPSDAESQRIGQDIEICRQRKGEAEE